MESVDDSQSINKALQSWFLLASVSGPLHNVCDKKDLKGSNNVAAEFLKSSLSSHLDGGAPGRPDREESIADTGVPLVTYTPPPKI